MSKLVFLILLLTTLPLSVKLGGVSFYTFDIVFFPFLIVTFFSLLRFAGDVEIRWSVEEKILIIFLGLMGISTALSVNVAVSFDNYLLWIRYGFLYWAIRHYFNSTNKAVTVFYDFVIVASVIAIFVGILQLGTGTKIGVFANYFGASVDESSRNYLNERISGTSKNSNVYGSWMVVYLITIITWWQFHGKSKLFTLVFLLVTSFLILATLSKAAVLFLFTALLIYLSCSGRAGGRLLTKMLYTIIGLSAVLSALLFTPIGVEILNRFVDRVGSSNSASYSIRIDVLSTIPALLSELKYVIFGTGANVFFETLEYENIYHNTFATWIDATSERAGVHNIIINFLTSFGVFASLLFFWSYASIIIKCKMLLRVRSHPAAVVAYVVLLASVIPSQFNTVIWSANFFPIIIFWMAYVLNQANRLQHFRRNR